MAKRTKPSRTVRRIGFGRRDKLVMIGALGLIGIGAIHFALFKPRIDIGLRWRAEFDRQQSDYSRMSGHVFRQEQIDRYNAETSVYSEQILQIVGRENFSAAAFEGTEQAMESFRGRVRHLSRKWLDHQRTRDPETDTNLVFIGTQRNPAMIARGQFLWNIPESLPDNVTPSMIQDNLERARGAYRLIQYLTSDPTAHQNEFNRYISDLGIPVLYVGADHNTQPFEPVWAPYRLIPEGIERDVKTFAEEATNFPVPASEWPSMRLPAPNDAFCALAHIDLLLDALYPPPFDEATMRRAQQNPASLTAEQQGIYAEWSQARQRERFGYGQTRGLEDLLDVNFGAQLVYYNLALDHVERLVDMAIDAHISQIIMIKILKQQDVTPFPDPWEIPEPEPEPEITGPSGPGPRGPEQGFGPRGPGQGVSGLEAEFYGQPGYAEGMGFGEGGDYWQQQAAPPEPTEPPIATVSPIFLRITGDYSRVMTFFLELSTTPNFYTVEEISIYTTRSDGSPIPGLPEGYVAADMWIMAPLYMPSVPLEIGLAANELMAQQATEQ